ETREVARLELKGQPVPTPVHTVTGERLRGLAHDGALIGRSAERRRLEAIAGRLGAGERIDVRISGEAGMGKSRLASWFAERLADEQVAHILVQADSIRRAVGYAPFAPLVAQRLKLGADADAERCR